MSEDNGEDNSRFSWKGLEEIAEDLKQEHDGWDGVSRVGCLAATVNRQGAFTQVILYNPWRHLLLLIIGAQAAVCQGCLCQSGEVQSESLEVAVLPWIERFCLECVAHHLSSQFRVKIHPLLCVYLNV